MNDALFIIDPGFDIYTSSTFAPNSFKITNLSTTGQNITSITLDLSTAIFPDVVYDPDGKGGDSVAKGFEIDLDPSSVPGTSGVKSFEYLQPRDGGFDALKINFSDFKPNQTLEFSIDTDPTSTKGAEQDNSKHFGSISGLELVGATATVTFADSEVLKGQFYRTPDSDTGSQATLAANLGTAPTIEAVGLTATATVANANQTVKVTGTPGSQVSLLVVDGALLTEGVGHDIDPFEANTAFAINEITTTIGANGSADVPVTLTRTETANGTGGLNYIVAKYQDGNAISSKVVLEYVPTTVDPGTNPGNASDTVVPTTVLDAVAVSDLSQPHTFSLTYTDNVAVDADAIDANDVKVIAPDGVTVLPATLSGVVDVKGDKTVMKATYSVAAPGGNWANQRGAYQVEIGAGQVSDKAGNEIAAGILGSFAVNVPHNPSATGVIRIEAEDYKAGTNGVEFYDFEAENFGGAYRPNEPVDIEVTGDTKGGNFNVGYIAAGETLTYDVVIPEAENYNLVLRVANPDTFSKAIDVVIDGKTYTAEVGTTGDYQVYTDVVINNVSLTAGTKELSLKFQAKDFNINYLELEPAEPVVDSVAPTAKLDTTTLAQQSNSTTAASFTVTFADDSGVKADTIDANDITVTAPDGTTLPVTLVGINAAGDGTPRTATYSVAAPGDKWDAADKGEYTVAVKAGVSDINGNNVAAKVLGKLNIDISGVSAPAVKPPTSQPSDDLTIRIEAEDYKAGVNGDTYLDTSRNNFGGAHRQDDVDLETTKDVVGGGYNVAWIETGEFLTYDVNVIESGKYDLVLRVATPSKDSKTVDVVVDGETYTAEFSNTGGWQAYQDVIVSNVDLSAGSKELRLNMKSGGFNLNYLELRSQQSATEPIGIKPPTTEPPVTQPPVTEPPVTEPPAFEPVVNIPSPETGIIRVEAEDYKPGTNGVEFYDFEAENFGGEYRPNEPVDIEVTGDVGGGFNVGYIAAGETLAYDVKIPQAQNYNLVLRVAVPTDVPQSLEATIGGKTYAASFSNTGGWQTYSDVVINNVDLSAGVQELQLKMNSNSFNINYVELVPAEPVIDAIAPSVALDNAPDNSNIVTLNQLTNSKTTANFSVTYADNIGIDIASIDASDVTVTSFNGAKVPVTLSGIDLDSNGTPLTATYSIAAPGGTWNAADVGDYAVAINLGAVSDINGNTTSAKNLGKLALNVLTPVSDGITRINTGANTDAVDSFGKLWKADANFTGGQAIAPIYNPIDNTKDDFIFQSQRLGDTFSYAVPVANGNYQVSLYLSELEFTDFGSRVFDVSLEGDAALDNLDIYKLTNNAFLDGENDASIVEISSLAIVQDGTLDLDFTSEVDEATLAGIVITPVEGAQVLIEESEQNTSVTEGGNTDTYQVLLNTKPTANVTVNLQLDGQTAVDKNSLVFTPQNWSTPQTVTVNAVDDAVGESFHTSTVGHTITTTDAAYGGLTVPSVSINITDNDSVEVKFTPKKEIDNYNNSIGNNDGPSTAAWGPDGRLYVGLTNGQIKVYTFDDDYGVLDTQTIDTIAESEEGNKNITGIAFNPFENDGTQPKVYVSHNQFYANYDSYLNESGFNKLTDFSPYSGQVSVLEGPGFGTITPVVDNIGISNHDHGVNGLTFDGNGDLLITVGSNTNAGVVDDAIGGIDESPFTAAILKAEITKPGYNGIIEYKMPDGWVAPEGLNLIKPDSTPAKPEESQGFGGIVEVVPGVDVSVYASGLRNPYDLVYATNGIVYATENSANGGFGEESTGADTQKPFNSGVTMYDELNIIEEGNYYGQPNRSRGQDDPRQNVYHYFYEDSTADYTAPIDTFASSTNGIIEYRSNTFDGQLRGNLITQKWNGFLYNVELSEDGQSTLNKSLLETEVVNDQGVTETKNLLEGLDVLTGFGGALISVDHSDSAVYVSTPVDNGTTNMVAYDISDWRAPASGGGQFTIGGINFSGSAADTTVEIGGKAATVTSVTEKRIVGLFPSFGVSDEIIGSAEYTEDNLLDITVASGGEISTITDAYQPLFI